MKLNKYTAFNILFFSLLSNNIYSMEYNPSPYYIAHNKQNSRNINEVIQQNIKLQEQLNLLNKKIKDMQEQHKREKEDKIREENFKKISKNKACEVRKYENIPCEEIYKYFVTKSSDLLVAMLNKQDNKLPTNPVTIHLKDSHEFYDALHNTISLFYKYFIDNSFYENNTNYIKYSRYYTLLFHRLNMEMINNKRWINYLESLQKECPIYDMKYDSIRGKIPSLIESNNKLKKKLDEYQKLLEEIDMIRPIIKIVLELSDKLKNLQETKKYEAILNIEDEIKNIKCKLYNEELCFKEEINKLNK